MSIIQMLIAQMFNTPPDVGDIGHSLRFRSSASAYLNRTPGVTTDRTKWTWSGWVKRGSLGVQQILFLGFAGNSDPNYTRLSFNASDALVVNGYSTNWRVTSSVYRDPSAHLHITFVYDSNNATANDRIKLYVNGAQVTSFSTTNNPSLGQTSGVNVTTPHYLSRNDSADGYIDGYMSRVCLVDGQALTPSSFGYFNTEINEWVSNTQSDVKAVVDAGGTNSFMLDFDDGTSTTTLGYDKSSKGNNWTCNNISLTTGATYDWMLDVPGNSYATLNPLVVGHSTLTNGNLTASGTGDLPTIMPSSDTWYFERGGVAQTWTPPAAFPSAAGDYNFGQRPFVGTPTGKILAQANLSDTGTVIVSGSFTGNASTNGPFIWTNGVPDTLTINGNAVTFGTHADKTAGGFKLRTSSASYNVAGSNTWTATITTDTQNIFKYNTAEGNP